MIARLSTASFLVVVPTIAGGAPLRRPVSPDRPMIIVPWTRQGGKAIEAISSDLRPYIVFQKSLMQRPSRRAAALAELAAISKQGIPLALHVRTHWPVDDRAKTAQEGRLAPLSVVRDTLAKCPTVVALIDAEQYAWTREQRDYFVGLLEVCDEAGVWLILDAGWHTGADWRELFLDPATRAAVRTHGRVFLPMWEMNIADAMFHEHSQLLGIWLSGAAPAWGANPQKWYWGEAGFADIGEDAGWRFGKRGGMRAAAAFIDRYPFYAHSVLLPGLTGACVFWIGGEVAPHAWNADGSLSRYWKETLEPAFLVLIRNHLIPERSAMLSRVRFQVRDDAGVPHIYCRRKGRSGSSCVRIAAGAGRSVHLAWTNDEFLSLPPGVYHASGWIRTERLQGEVCLDLTWFEKGRWRHARSVRLSGTRPWTLCELRTRIENRARYGMLQLRVDGTDGDAWFDDVSLTAAGKEGENLLDNPGFERPREAGAMRPAGWRPAPVYGSPDLHLCRRGPNAVWHAAYGVFHRAEFLPATSTAFPGAWLPPGGVLVPGRASRSAVIVDVTDPDAVRLPEAWKIDVPRPDSPFVWRTPRFLWIANSAENTPSTQKFDVAWRGFRFSGEMPLHHFAIMLVEKNEPDADQAVLRVLAYSPRAGDAFGLLVEGLPGGVRKGPVETPAGVSVHPADGGLRFRFDHRQLWQEARLALNGARK